MTIRGRITSIYMAILLNIVRILHIRIPWILFIRFLRRENKTMALPNFATPDNIEDFMKRFQYTMDPLNGSVDYVSHPERVYYTLMSRDLKDGDCDDGHWFFANAVKRCKNVTEVYFLTSGYASKKKHGAHATCVYKYNGKWYHYDWKIYPIDSPNNAPLSVAKRYAGDDAHVTYKMWESVGEYGNDRSEWKILGINSYLQVQ